MNTIGHLINGEVRFDAARTQDVYNPATGAPARQVALAAKATVEEAITAAQAAYPAWRNTPPLKRARILFRFKELLEANAENSVH
jgi:malonate-semialdehyde dehydrogenase (acetylating)/methylmalonate-semialdehyde dehydrogenase